MDSYGSINLLSLRTVLLIHNDDEYDNKEDKDENDEDDKDDDEDENEKNRFYL